MLQKTGHIGATVKSNHNRSLLVIDLVSSLLLLLFVYTAVSKLSRLQPFINTMEDSPILKPYAGTLGWAVPVTELLVSVFLFVPSLRFRGLVASLFLLSLFTFYIGWMMLFAPRLPCSCGGIIQSLSWNQHVIFNLSFMLLTIYAIYLQTRFNRKRMQGPP